MNPLLVTVEDLDADGAQTRYAFTRSPVRLGRSPLNDLVLDRTFVSQWHAVVEFYDDTRYVDLGSTNGTLRDGQRLPAQRETDLGETATVTIGGLRLTFTRGPMPPGLSDPGSGGAPGGASNGDDAPATSVYAERSRPVAPAPPGVSAVAAARPAPAAPPPHRALPESPRAHPSSNAPPRLLGVAAGRLVPREDSTLIGPAPRAPAAEVATVVSGDATLVSPAPFGAHDVATAATPGRTAMTSGVLAALAQSQTTTAAVAPIYSQYVVARAALLAAVEQALGAAPTGGHGVLVAILEQDFPLLTELPGVAAIVAAHGATLRETARPVAVPVRLGQLATYLRSEPAEPLRADEADALVERAANVLLAFATAFTALRQGHDAFRDGVATPRAGASPLATTRDPRGVLAYLFARDGGQGDPLEDLRRAYADVMAHQVGLLGAVREGVRALLARLSPAALAQEVAVPPVARGSWARLRSWWAGPTAARWDRYVRRHAELAEEDRALMDTLFGPEFARAYRRVTGEPYQGASGR